MTVDSRVIAKASRLLNEHGYLSPTDVVVGSQPEQGLNNEIFTITARGRTWVVKRLTGNAARARAEAYGLSTFGPLGLAPWPAISDVDIDGEIDAEHGALAIYPWVEGRRPRCGADDPENVLSTMVMLDGFDGCPPAWRSNANPESAVRLLDIVEGWVADLDAADRPAVFWVELRSRWAAAIQRAADLASAGGPADNDPKICHGDPNIENLVVRDDGQLVLLDWEFSGAGDRMYELADFIQHPKNQEFREAVTHAIERHPERYFGGTQERDRFAAYLALLPLVWSVKVAARLFDHLPSQASRDTFEQRSLAYLETFESAATREKT